MKNYSSIFTLAFWGWCVALTSAVGQVTTLPNSIGIGPSTNPAIPLHINKSGEAMRIDGASNPFAAYYNNGLLKGYVQTTPTTLTIGTSNTTSDLEFRTNTLSRMLISGSTGDITMSSRLNAGSGLRLTGPLVVSGSSGAIGQVLMTLGNTSPMWVDVVQNPQVGFEATYSSSITLAHNTENVLSGFTENWDDGSMLNPLAGEITIPSSGLYRFECKLSLGRVGNNPAIEQGKLRFALYQNGTLIRQMHFDYKINGLGLAVAHQNFVESVKLSQGDRIVFSIVQSNESNTPILLYVNGTGGDTQFRGYKIY